MEFDEIRGQVRGVDAAVPRPGARRRASEPRPRRTSTGCGYCRKRYRFEESLRIFVREVCSEEMPPELKQKLAALAHPALREGLAKPRRVGQSSGRSTSPGSPRSSHGTSTGSSARAPSSGTHGPDRPVEHDRVAAHPSVGGRHHFARARPPRCDDAVDGRRRQVGPVGEDHRRRRRAVAELMQAAAK